jgi:iron-sulfur cluster assembly protein
MKITVTEKAVEQLKNNGLGKSSFLRLGVQPGGCAGMSYTAVSDTNLTDNDKIVFERDDLRVVANSEFLLVLDGLNIDFSDDLIQPGLILNNPNAKKSCGCGASFAPAGVADDCSTCGGCG